MEHFYQSIWLHLMQLLYDPTGSFVFVLGIVASILFSAISFKSKTALRKYALLFISLTLLVGYGIQYSKEHYTYVPDIYFGEESLEYVYQKLSQANLVCPRNQQNFDEKAMERLKDGTDFSHYNFVVTGSTPSPEKFVKQGSTVLLSVTWVDLLTAINLAKNEEEFFDPIEFYGNPESAVIYDYTMSCLWLQPLPVGLKATPNRSEVQNFLVYPPMTEKTIVRGRLVDYFTNETVDEAACYLGDEMIFPHLQNGTYYFSCSCEGYQLAVSRFLFRVHHDSSQDGYDREYGSYLDVDLEKEASYSPYFKIKLQDKQGNPLAGTSVSMNITREDDPSPNRRHLADYITNENGYLCNQEGWYLMSGGILEFQVCTGYIAGLSLDGQNYVPVPLPDGAEVCITME